MLNTISLFFFFFCCTDKWVYAIGPIILPYQFFLGPLPMSIHPFYTFMPQTWSEMNLTLSLPFRGVCRGLKRVGWNWPEKLYCYWLPWSSPCEAWRRRYNGVKSWPQSKRWCRGGWHKGLKPQWKFVPVRASHYLPSTVSGTHTLPVSKDLNFLIPPPCVYTVIPTTDRGGKKCGGHKDE